MIKGEDIAYSLPERLNLGAFYLDANLDRGRGDKTAILYRDQALSFRDLWRLTNKVGNVLKALGVEPENRVLLILDDCPEWVAGWLATMKVGAVGAHAYTYLKAHDYAYLLELVRPKVVIVGATALEALRAAKRTSRHPKAVLVAGEGADELERGEFDLGRMIAMADAQLDIEPTHPDDIAFWNFSSGSTGQPKGVPHTHRDGVIAYESFNRILGYAVDDIILRVHKLFFHYSREHLLLALRNGAANVLFEEKSTAPLMYALIEKYRPSVLINVPTMMRAMLETPEDARSDLSCIGRSMSSGEHLSAPLYESWLAAFGCEVVNRFGSAESGQGYLCNRPGVVVPGSAGKVAPLAEIKLIDADGNEVPKGQAGRLLVRCESAGTGYVRELEKSRTTFPGGGWINTGDLFVCDENDTFWYAGRADDMVKVSGVWISPLEIELGLQRYPSVKEAVALGVKDGDGLTKIKAFVVLRDDAEITAEMPEKLKRYCKETLAPHKFPSAIELVDELPKTGQGKIDRRQLRERAL